MILLKSKLFKFSFHFWKILKIFNHNYRFKALAKGVYPIDDFNNLPPLDDEEQRKFRQRLFLPTKKKDLKKTKKLKRLNKKKKENLIKWINKFLFIEWI